MCIMDSEPWTSFSVTTCPFRGRFQSFSSFFPMKPKCAAYMEKARWGDGFVCPALPCRRRSLPHRHSSRTVLRCRKCRHDTGLTVGTVMERSHMPLSTWFWAAYLVASQTPGISAVQFQRQLGLSRYETAFGILHKLRAGMVRPNQDRIGGKPGEHVEIDETWVGGRTRGEGRGVHHKVARRLCRRGSSSETGNRAGQAKGRTLCRACQARRSTRSERRLALWVRGERRCSEDADRH